VRALHVRDDLIGKFDFAICCEVIEHIVDDSKSMRDIARCLKPEGRLLLTTPNFNLKPIDPAHTGPFPSVENGRTVRKGYHEKNLDGVCEQAGLCADSISYCTGFLSQTIIRLYFETRKVHPLLAWCAIHPFRVLPPLLDGWLSRRISYPPYSICLE